VAGAQSLGWFAAGPVRLAVADLPGRLASAGQLSFAEGDLLMVLATLDWALYSLLLRRWNAYFQLPPFTLLGALVLLGLVMLAPFYGLGAVAGGRASSPARPTSPPSATPLCSLRWLPISCGTSACASWALRVPP